MATKKDLEFRIWQLYEELCKDAKPGTVIDINLSGKSYAREKAKEDLRKKMEEDSRKLQDIFNVLYEALQEGGVAEWLCNYNKYLDGRRPVDLLIKGENEAVLRAAIDIRDNIL